MILNGEKQMIVLSEWAVMLRAQIRIARQEAWDFSELRAAGREEYDPQVARYFQRTLRELQEELRLYFEETGPDDPPPPSL